MLKRLHVKNYVLIDSLDIEFPEGLVIITGQTGAGKSIITGALSVALGAKADASLIGASADNCVIEAEFIADSEDAHLKALFDEQGIDWDGGDMTVRRVISRSGRSRAFLDDCPVSLQVLSSISSRLLDVHSQHQTLMLSDRKFQLSVLDSFAGNGGLLKDYREAWTRYNSLISELDGVSASIEKALAEKEYKEALFRQLDQARLREGELEELEAEQKRLSNAEEIKSVLCSVESTFSGGFDDESRSLSSSLKEAEKGISKISGFIPEVSGLAARIESCRLELDDIYAEVSGINASVDVSPERLQAVDDRISLIYGLLQRHSCRDVSELVAIRDSLSDSISGITSLEERKEELERQLKEAAEDMHSKAVSLHRARAGAAASLSGAIQDRLHFLELPFAVFRVDVTDTGLSSTGSDTVTFLFSSTGKDPVDVARCASGGELSRIMLSLKAIMSQYRNMPTMIFDEIDTGVSGSVADKMGTMICEMGRNMQVFAITHLPQVAAKGSAHYLVSKTVDPSSSRAETTIKRLSDEQRVLEVARMLSGSALTDAAIANAKALLKG